MNSPLDRDILINRFKNIETNTPVRKEKLRKLDELYQSIKDDAQLTPQEILNLTKDLLQRGLTIRQTFFSDAIHPILSRQIEQGNVEAIKLMVKLEQHLIAHQGITKDYGYTAVELINKGIRLAPNDEELLQMYEVKTANYLYYSIHEVPIGIIYGNDGATIEQCDELLEFVHEYEQVCKKLGVDRNELIKDCKYFYPLYKDYLKDYKSYNGFKDYLIRNEHRTT
jgi:hypothetical protein